MMNHQDNGFNNNDANYAYMEELRDAGREGRFYDNNDDVHMYLEEVAQIEYEAQQADPLRAKCFVESHPAPTCDEDTNFKYSF